MSIRHLMKSLALLGTASLLATFAAATSQAEEQSLSLALRGADAGGQAAISALGGNLAAVAAQYGKTPEELRRLLRHDSTLRIDRNGKLFYKERAVKLPAAPSQRAGILDGGLYPLAQTFSLHSKPGSNRLLILNFQGATVTGTFWNTAQRRPRIVATPFNTEGTASTFSDGERTAIQQIWQRVAEDYAPFDVDVTTDINAAARAPAGSLSATAVITRQSDYNVAAPGVAYTSTFGNAAYEPAFVAYDTLGRNPKYIAEAVSHELGHRLGLDHDGTWRSAYYGGQGRAPMTWAPIMGNSYVANVTQFSKGEYNNANNKQDDFAVMNRYLPFRTDNAGGGAATAAVFPASTSGGRSSGSVDGVLERLGDLDYFAITAGAGAFSATVTPASLNPNADLELSLVDGAGTVVATANPDTALGASISTTLSAGGTYYIKVNGAGYGSAASTGYSNYGSRGNYRLTASYAASAISAPRAAITASATSGKAPLTVNFSAAASSGITAYGWNFGNGATSTQRTASARFDTPGSYTVELKVTGAAGYTNATSTEIVVNKTFTANVALARNNWSDGTVGVTAFTSSFIVDGFRINPDKIYGRWSGAVSAEGIGTGKSRSGSNFNSPPARGNACITFTITKIEYINSASAAPEQTPKLETYLPASPVTATSCPPQQASR